MKSIITIIFSVFLVGCPKNEVGGFTSISKGSLFGAGAEGFEKENMIISSKEEFASFLSKLDKTNKVSKTFTESFNFSKESIVAVIDKVRSSGGYAIEITEVINEKDTIVIKVNTKSPKPLDNVSSVITQPYHIVKIKKTNKEIKFISI